MGKVFHLFKQHEVEDESDLWMILKIAVADSLASKVELACTVKQLSMHFDALDRVINGLTDADTQTQFERLAGQACQDLAVASLRLSQQMEELSAMKKQLAEVVARRPVGPIVRRQ